MILREPQHIPLEHTPESPNPQMEGIPSEGVGWESGVCSRGMLENS